MKLNKIDKPNKVYAEVLESGAIDQFISAMEQPFVVRGALMPDAHQGYSLPIGAVVATEGVVIPAWVGYDIGCGMCAFELKGVDLDEVMGHSKEIFDRIYQEIPVGFNKNATGLAYSLEGLTGKGEEIAVSKDYNRALGSLGGGNHFIEIGYDENETVWVVIHSGSRGAGHGIATHYMKLAHPDGKAKEGHHGLSVDSEEGQDYIKDQAWCLNYALANRSEMMKRVVSIIASTLDVSRFFPNYKEMINRNHNHAVEKEGLWIHRKGATQAEEGMMGVIPGNMRDGSFIVRGKGNPESLCSSSHGAGRVLGRRAAKEQLVLEDFTDTMIGITAKVDEKTIDESPFAYKDLFEVMDLQKDLVEVVAHIKPLINIKG